MVKFNYTHENDEVEVEYEDEHENLQYAYFKLADLFASLPSETADYQWIIEKVRNVRREKIQNLGNYMQRVIDLTVEEAQYRQKLVQLGIRSEGGEEISKQTIDIYKEVIKACSVEKNTMNEFRHAQKFLSNEEGRLLEELARLELMEQ